MTAWRWSTRNPRANAAVVGGLFFPQRPALGLDHRGYSPSVRAKIVTAGVALKSFATAAKGLEVLAEVKISDRHVGRMTEEIGAELARQRDEQVEAHRHRRLKPRVETVPPLAVVEVDGGRVHTRAEGCGPGVHEPGWRESKVANLLTMQSETFAADPQPEPPAAFTDAKRVSTLVQQIHGFSRAEEAPADAEGVESALAAEAEEEAAEEEPRQAWQPERLVRTCVATLLDSAAFGAMVATEAQERNLYAAPKGAFVADGQKYNWSIQQRWFREFVAINDFLHVLGYVYAAAQAVGGTPAECWERYQLWLRACWQGRVAEVIAALVEAQARLGEVRPDESPPTTDPRLVVAQARTYLENNQTRMNYPLYRQQGLPITSALVESVIKEFNYRVKGSEKFWLETGAEKVLQVRAAYLCEDDRLAKHLAQRPGSPYRRNARRRAA